jgi:hypothetical protein
MLKKSSPNTPWPRRTILMKFVKIRKFPKIGAKFRSGSRSEVDLRIPWDFSNLLVISAGWWSENHDWWSNFLRETKVHKNARGCSKNEVLTPPDPGESS